MELLLSEALDDSVEVTSGGTYGMPSWPVSPPMAELLLETTGTASFAEKVENFRSQRLTEQMVNDADLILTATGGHRSEVLNLSPLALKRTMSLGELARLAQSVDPANWANATTDAERLKVLIPAAMAARHANPAGPEADDIIDPYKRSAQTYQLSHNQIKTHIKNLTNALHAQ
jgi:protein-tyrosine phosphatase